MRERAMDITLQTGTLIGKPAYFVLNNVGYFTHHFPIGYLLSQLKSVLPVLFLKWRN